MVSVVGKVTCICIATTSINIAIGSGGFWGAREAVDLPSLQPQGIQDLMYSIAIKCTKTFILALSVIFILDKINMHLMTSYTLRGCTHSSPASSIMHFISPIYKVHQIN